MTQISRTIGGRPGITTRLATTDAVQTIASSLMALNGKAIIGLDIYVDAQAVRYAFGVDPVEDGSTYLGRKVAATGLIELTSFEQIANFRFISAASGSHGVLQLMPFYEEVSE